jgi:ABC-2 type transport system permease protein
VSRLGVYAGLFRTALLANLQYRVAGSIWMFGMILEPLIYLAVWSAVAATHGGTLAGFDARDMAAYYLVFFLVQHVTFSWVMETFQYRIQEGSLAFELLRPVHPIVADVMENVSFKLVMLFMILPAALAIWIGYQPRFAAPATALLWFVPSLGLAFVLRFAAEWSLALCAFWTTRTSAINRAYYSVALFLSGRAAPLAFLPTGLRETAEWLPFYPMVGLPVDLALGRLSPEQALRGLALQLAWTLVAFGLIAFTWKRALRRFAAVGS